ncbi:TruA2 [Desulforapulum autotrophicum HRM2]|uniref:tRNA pseudouridine synthase n=1 Tax=Desulforapulum autotrophicum (strain ATCC 43914 / DSM 3382 / VKM B-1955 / HRM2) TaxID=177437 RepID=C0QBI7_DESAH|nr:tRNA pseudouridine synthase A [Desulforapulum autotrophicum]ACN16989.1 TruA2 [Desulforapulum autotrophicum HRM2]
MEKYYYLIHIQYLGFRYHGWLKQPGLKTVEAMVEKTVAFILGHSDFKILGSSRTDAMVSANHSAFELFVHEPLNVEQLVKDFNQNLPNDIRVIKAQGVDRNFSIINAPRTKAYIYLFAFGEKCHPFCAPLISSFCHWLDIDLMKQGALLFQGRHNFRSYCTKPGTRTTFKREVLVSKIEENRIFKANFFPAESYAYHIHSKGFMRYQVRLIMGQLLSLGRGEIGLEDIKVSLKGMSHLPLRHIAPSSGLMLNKIEFH